MMDALHHPCGRGVRPCRVPARRRRDPARRGRRAAAGVDAAVRPDRRRSAGPTAPGPCGWRRRGRAGACSGRAARAPSGPSPASSRTTTCTTPSCRGRGCPRCCAQVYEIAERHDLMVMNVFHAGDGNLHPLLVFDKREPGVMERVHAAGEEIVRGQRGRRRRAVGRARHRPREARPHAADVRRRPTSTARLGCARRSTPTAWPTPTRCCPPGSRRARDAAAVPAGAWV